MRVVPAVTLSAILGLFAAATADATVVVVTSSGVTFSPNSVTITEGDTVRWVNSSGSHTTTSGTGSGDPQAGVLWNAPLNPINTEFSRQFNTAGTFPYYCAPHELFGMTGTVIVEAAAGACVCANHADPQIDGVINVLDVVQTVNVAFKGFAPVTDADCPYERTDVDCNGFTNVIDVVKMVNVAFKGFTDESQFCVPCP